MTTEHAAPTSIDNLAPKMKLKGTVKKIDLYGALVDIGVGRLGLLHISQLTEQHVNNVSDIVKEGEEITVWIQQVDQKKGRINLTMIEPAAVTWNDIDVNKVFSGKVVRVEKFGAFVDIGAERPGLVHVSELAKGYVGDPSEVVTINDEIEVKVIGVNRRKKQIDLSVRALEEESLKVEVSEEEETTLPTAMELALRQALEGSGMQMPERRSKKHNKKERRRRQQEEREDIFLRTLQQHSNE